MATFIHAKQIPALFVKGPVANDGKRLDLGDGFSTLDFSAVYGEDHRPDPFRLTVLCDVVNHFDALQHSPLPEVGLPRHRRLSLRQLVSKAITACLREPTTVVFLRGLNKKEYEATIENVASSAYFLLVRGNVPIQLPRGELG